MLVADPRDPAADTQCPAPQGFAADKTGEGAAAASQAMLLHPARLLEENSCA